MSDKKFILNADDFGMSKVFNKAILEGYHRGFLVSASIVANGKAFDTAVNEIIPECPNLGVGVHLNIMEGKSLLDNVRFNNNYIKLMYMANEPLFLNKVEKEFRLQIEKVYSHTKVTHLDSHVHVHAIPKIFELTCKLAKEYEIKQVRTQFEHFYMVRDIKKHLNFKYPTNLFKILLLNHFTFHNNRKLVKEYGLKTNDYIVGVGYTGIMDDNTILEGLLAIKEENTVVEALIHPCNFNKNLSKNSHQIEFMITQNMNLKDKIERLGFDITNYKC